MLSSTLQRVAVTSLSAATLLLAGCGGAGNTFTPASTASVQNSPARTTQSAIPSLKCFSGNGGTCSISSTGVVTLNNTASGSFAGVYFASSNNLKGLTLSQLATLSFTLSGSQQPSQGSPRVSIPVTYNGSATTAYVYSQDCSFGAVVYPETVDAFGTSCKEMQGYSSPLYQPDWSAFTSAFSTATITAPPFFLADAGSPGTWTLSDLQISKK